MVKRSPLYALQKKLGAKFTEFAGFEMPIQYSSIKDEHLIVRRKVGIFDVSHMSNVWITGDGADTDCTAAFELIDTAGWYGDSTVYISAFLRRIPRT